MKAEVSDLEVAKRDALFEHEMFNSKQRGNTQYPTQSISYLEAGWGYELDDLLATLEALRAEGLVEHFEGGYYCSTQAGRIARERRWRAKGKRHPVLTSSLADVKDVVVALIKSGGYESDAESENTLNNQELEIFLPDAEAGLLEDVVQALIGEKIIDRGPSIWDMEAVVLGLSPIGARHYAQQVVPRLGIVPPATILAPVQPGRLLFDELGLSPDLADNLRYRWEEAERCEAARAWLAANIMFGSILEAALHGWLGGSLDQAMNAPSAPKRNKSSDKGPVPFDKWGLHDLITVAVELGLIDPALNRHASALRENRNLIHPSRQMQERSMPDGALTAISKQVVNAVLSSMARVRS